MKTIVYSAAAVLLLLSAYLIFKRIIRNAYRQHGFLTPIASLLQLVIFLGFFTFPYTFAGPSWPYVWRLSGSSSYPWQVMGLVLICVGALVAFGTMAWFGIRRAFGIQLEGLISHGPYRFSRNPQILGGYLLVIGTALQWASFYALGWIILYGCIMHWMVTTEEEHLLRVFGQEYASYCERVPRYCWMPGMTLNDGHQN